MLSDELRPILLKLKSHGVQISCYPNQEFEELGGTATMQLYVEGCEEKLKAILKNCIVNKRTIFLEETIPTIQYYGAKVLVELQFKYRDSKVDVTFKEMDSPKLEINPASTVGFSYARQV